MQISWLSHRVYFLSFLPSLPPISERHLRRQRISCGTNWLIGQVATTTTSNGERGSCGELKVGVVVVRLSVQKKLLVCLGCPPVDLPESIHIYQSSH